MHNEPPTADPLLVIVQRRVARLQWQRKTEEGQLRGLPPIQQRRAGGDDGGPSPLADDANFAKKDGRGQCAHAHDVYGTAEPCL
jgi:hypothetical protein